MRSGEGTANEAVEGHRWSPGEHIVFRQLWRGRVWAAIPAVVVENTDQAIAVYVRPRTTFAAPACERSEYLRVALSGNWQFQMLEWVAQHHLWAAIPGEACSVWTIWSEPDWTHLGWKINPEEPLTRTRLGLDTTDLVLDAVIDPDAKSWHWKDEEEFREAVELGLISSERARQIRADTNRLADSFTNERVGQIQSWARWRPSDGWGIPKLGSGWDRV